MKTESYMPSVEVLKHENKIYPERAFSSVDKSIEKLKKLESGEIKKVELSEEERFEILSFENKLGTEFTEIFKIKINSAVLYPEYLLTDKGKELFRSCSGFDIEGGEIDSLVRNIYRNRARIGDIGGIQLRELEGYLKNILRTF